MKVFILGAKGFVGSSFVRYCALKKIKFVPIDIDNYKKYIGKKCDVFINVNGNSKKYIAEKYPDKDFKMSFLSVQNTLKDFKFKKYIYISSIDVYNNFSDIRKNQEDADIDIEKQSFYGFHKYLAEQLIRKHLNDWLIIRCGGFVGKGLKKNSIFDIVHSLPLRVHSLSRYQYLAVDELPKIVFSLIKKKLSCQIFNVCGKGLISLKEVAKFAPNYTVRYASKKVEKETYCVSIKKISRFYKIPSTKESVKEFIKKNT